MKAARWHYVDTFTGADLGRSIELAYHHRLDKFYLKDKKYMLFDGRYREVAE